jgi:hypothetical protein
MLLAVTLGHKRAFFFREALLSCLGFKSQVQHSGVYIRLIYEDRGRTSEEITDSWKAYGYRCRDSTDSICARAPSVYLQLSSPAGQTARPSHLHGRSAGVHKAKKTAVRNRHIPLCGAGRTFFRRQQAGQQVRAAVVRQTPHTATGCMMAQEAETQEIRGFGDANRTLETWCLGRYSPCSWLLDVHLNPAAA